MTANPFEPAFDLIGQAADKASRVSRRELPSMADFEVVRTRGEGDVSVTVRDAQITELSLRPGWFELASRTDVERAVRETANEALAAWSQESLDRLRTATPQLSEISTLVDSARKRVREAFDDEMRRAREL